jgi:hypothetical protein
LADAHDSKSCSHGNEGSIPSFGTIITYSIFIERRSIQSRLSGFFFFPWRTKPREVWQNGLDIWIAFALIMGSVLCLRVLNLIRTSVFTIYDLWIHAYPVALVNGIIIFIDLYYLVDMRRAKDYFQPLLVMHDSSYLNLFLVYYTQDIAKFFPNLSFHPEDAQYQFFFILRDMVPAGLVILSLDEQNRLWVTLDYAIPGYRDFKTGHYIFSQQSTLLHNQRTQEVFAITESPLHARYLKKIGYDPDPRMGVNVFRYRMIV